MLLCLLLLAISCFVGAAPLGGGGDQECRRSGGENGGACRRGVALEDSEDNALLHLRKQERRARNTADSKEEATQQQVKEVLQNPELQEIWQRMMGYDRTSEVGHEDVKSLLSMFSAKASSLSSQIIAASEALSGPFQTKPCEIRASPPSRTVWLNFNGITDCYEQTTQYCPTTSDEVAELVKQHKQVRATGATHSWTPFTCTTGPAPQAATVGLGQLNKILELDTQQKVVRVQGGVRTRSLLQFVQRSGYTLKTYPYYIDQTIAGAVATATHGSDLLPGQQTMSSLIRHMTLVLANGTKKQIDREKDPELMREAAISVGKLGIAVELDLDVEPDYCVRGSTESWSEAQFLNWLKEVSAPGGSLLVQDPKKNETAKQIFWYPLHRQTIGGQQVKSPPGCDPQPPRRDQETQARWAAMQMADDAAAEAINGLKARNPRMYEAYAMQTTNSSFCHGDCLSSDGQITTSVLYGEVLVPAYQYEQYEFAVPLHKSYQCMNKLFNGVFRTDRSRAFFTGNPSVFRFVGKDDNQLLSATTDGDRIFLNMDIDVAYRSHTQDECTVLDELLALFHSDDCSARLHWGKTGWETMDYKKAQAMYPELPKFVQRMKKWDPEGKFVGFSPVFIPGAPPLNTGHCMAKVWWDNRNCASKQRQVSRCACTAQGAQCQWLLP